jgi:hypothetical protein
MRKTKPMIVERGQKTRCFDHPLLAVLPLPEWADVDIAADAGFTHAHETTSAYRSLSPCSGRIAPMPTGGTVTRLAPANLSLGNRTEGGSTDEAAAGEHSVWRKE